MFVVAVTDSGVVLAVRRAAAAMDTTLCVVAGALANLATEVAVMLLPVGVLVFILADNDFGNNVVGVKESVVSHGYANANSMLPVPAVNVVTLSLPIVEVEKVKPPPGFEMV